MNPALQIKMYSLKMVLEVSILSLIIGGIIGGLAISISKNKNEQSQVVTTTPSPIPTVVPTIIVTSQPTLVPIVIPTLVPTLQMGQKEVDLARLVGTWTSVTKTNDIILCEGNTNGLRGNGDKSDMSKYDTIKFDWTYDKSWAVPSYNPPKTKPDETKFEGQLSYLGWNLCASDSSAAAGSGSSYKEYRNNDGRFLKVFTGYGNAIEKGGEEQIILMNVQKGFSL